MAAFCLFLVGPLTIMWPFPCCFSHLLAMIPSNTPAKPMSAPAVTLKSCGFFILGRQEASLY